MKKILTSALLISLLTISCKKEETAEPITTDDIPVTSEASSVQNNTDEATVNAVPSITNQPTTTMNGLNPAHGQPGHRCEIAVGAPLNSTPTAPSNNASNNTQPIVVPANAAASPMSNTTATGMNPAHGQPGHRCEIPVGAPLSQVK
ncbi:hypothetical protein [uncultured Flavobacterium sp.]|uniref:hypothetical protein n=1 Tax=uncultured Flavobacterium sp. TaxID=165435 RepID=UPI0030EF16E8|tara:strand:- start:357559 stop:357999 length:441 start_codon:yes stop_codon:yes gene_type:complete